MRVRNGWLSAEQVVAVGCIGQRFGRDARDVTDRQHLMLHWIRIEEASPICPAWCEADVRMEPVKDDSSSSTSATTARQRPVWR